MIITGCFSEIEKQIDLYLGLCRNSILANTEFSFDLSISSNGKKIILIDKTTLEEMKIGSHTRTVIDGNAFVMDEEIYRLFHNNILQNHNVVEKSNCNQGMSGMISCPKTEKDNNKTEGDITKTVCFDKAQKGISELTMGGGYNDTYKKDTALRLSDEYRIENHLDDSMRLSKPCVFAIKYIEDNYFILFYRNSVYDRGSDTTFRHYLCHQPGILVAYMYFKDLSSLRYQFEQFGKKLRHNGQNILSRNQSDQLVHHYTKCWV